MYRLTVLLFVCLLLSTPCLASTDQQPLVLAAVTKQVSETFAHLDTALQQAARELGTTGLQGDAARQVLLQTCRRFSAAVDCSTVDAAGRMLTVEPAPYRRFEGKDISGQHQVRQLQKSRRPVFSTVFRSVEGFDAVDLEYPVFNPAGELIGSVSILIKPEKLLGEIISPLAAGLPVAVWAMEPGGRILYDVDSGQVGLNLFSAPLYRPYTSLLRLGRQIAKAPQDSGSYRFKNKTGQLVVKQAFWQTVSLYGTAWRLVGIHQEPAAGTVKVGLPVGRTVSVQEGLQRLAGQAGLQKALETGDKKMVSKHLQQFYEQMPGIYAVQWVDADGVNRFGYPAENSLTNYDFHADQAPSDKQTLEILKYRKPSGMTAPLFEERSGTFRFQPVFSNGSYLGMLYTITLTK